MDKLVKWISWLSGLGSLGGLSQPLYKDTKALKSLGRFNRRKWIRALEN